MRSVATELGFHRFGGCKDVSVYNSQVRHIGSYPLTLRVQPADAPARFWIFYETLPIPRDLACIERVLEDTILAPSATPD
jgi:hypothetical protein